MIQNRLISLQCTLNTLNLNIIMIFIIGYCRLLVRFPKCKFGKERQPLYSHQPIILKLTITFYVYHISIIQSLTLIKKMTFTLLFLLNNYLKKNTSGNCFRTQRQFGKEAPNFPPFEAVVVDHHAVPVCEWAIDGVPVEVVLSLPRVSVVLLAHRILDTDVKLTPTHSVRHLEKRIIS